MTSNSKPEPSVQQAITQLAQTVEQGFTRLDAKLEALTDQVGHLTEGLTEIKLMIQQQAEVAKQQTEVAKQQAESVRQQTEVAKQQAENVKSLADSVSTLVAMLNK
jgi:Skp family chaperone for outer membrane proteins